MPAKKSAAKKAAKKSARRPAPPAARALVVSLTHIDEDSYGWDGRSGCTGCGIDASRVAETLGQGGYAVTALADATATRDAVLAGLRQAAAATRPGDTFLFYYSGHGGQMPDASGDEAREAGGRPGADETLVCFDSELIDDSLDEIWKSFPAGAVIYMLSDSCNSGTNYRNSGPRAGSPIRPMNPVVASEMAASLLHIGGCRDSFSSYGLDDGGEFTTALLRSWDGGRGPATWQTLFEAAAPTLLRQRPQLNTYGPDSERLLDAIPFSPFAETDPARLPAAAISALRGPAPAAAGPEEDAPLDDARLSGELPFDVPAPDARRGPAEARGLPIGESSAREVTRWLMQNFGPALHSAGDGTPFGPDILCAIVCQETAYFWLPLLRQLREDPRFIEEPLALVDLVVSRCVLDASGDYPGTGRRAFPRDTGAFRERYGRDFTAMLIEEANKTRALRGYSPKQWTYKGYGIFQFDLQEVVRDEEFFRERRWYDFSACAEKCVGELKQKLKEAGGDLWESIRRYNGSGPAARAYRDNVRTFSNWTANEIAKLPATRPAGARSTRNSIAPSARPRLSQSDLAEKLAPFGIDREKHPLLVVGICGYYLDTMGRPGVNDRGIYDDAIFIDSPDGFATFNGNTDPSRHRAGHGTGSKKGMARLKPGAWFCHKLDYHGSAAYGPYRAICQRLGSLTVIRDGKNGADYEDSGSFGINIHKGSYNGTSSLGCQTIHPDQWPSFIALAMDLAKRHFGGKWERTVIPYILLEA